MIVMVVIMFPRARCSHQTPFQQAKKQAKPQNTIAIYPFHIKYVRDHYAVAERKFDIAVNYLVRNRL